MALKTALTIGGSDSSGGAGIQVDLKTFSVLGVYGMTAITAITAQNTLGVKESFAVPAAMVAQQIDVTAGDIEVDACKTGMLGTAQVIEAVEDAIDRNKLQRYVCDPVMATKNGDKLLDSDAVATLKKRLFPLATVVTPNLREAATLSGLELPTPMTVALAKDLARRISDAGARAVLIKGIESSGQTVDLLLEGREFLELSADTMPANKTHGSGCAFSAAITAGLANRLGLVDAIDQAKQLVNMAIQYSDGQGRGIAPVNVLAFAPKKK